MKQFLKFEIIDVWLIRPFKSREQKGKYSGTPLVRPALGRKILVVLTGVDQIRNKCFFLNNVMANGVRFQLA